MSLSKGFRNVKSLFASNRVILVLLLILFVGSWLRFDGATWGLPLRLHPDEGRIVDNAIKMANAHRYEVTGDFNHPNHTPIKLQVLSFWAMRHTITAISIAQLSYDVVKEDIKQFENIPSQIQNLPLKAQLFLLNCGYGHPITFSRENDNSLYVSVARALSALFGVICIFFAWLIGKQIHKNVGIICALLFALYPNFIEHSHYITPEIYQTAFTMAMIYFAIIYINNPKFKILFLACLCAALAFCTKYTALFSFPIVIISIICAILHDSRTHAEVNSIFKNVLKCIYTCIIAFIMLGICVFAISPILILDITSVYVNVMSEARATHLGADGLGYWGRLFFYLKCYAYHSGIIIVSFTIWGLIRLYKEKRSVFLLLLMGVLYAPITATLSLHWDRWGVPFYAFALILASIGIWKVYELLKSVYQDYFKQHLKVQKKKLALSFSVVLLIIISLTNLFFGSVAKTMYFAIAHDTRNVSLNYVSEIGATKDNTLYEGFTPFNPTGPATIFNSFEEMDISKPLKPEIKFIVLSSTMYSRYYAEPNKYKKEISFYNSLKADNTIVKEIVPVDTKESYNDINNIINSLKTISGFNKGGYSGPTLVFYKYIMPPYIFDSTIKFDESNKSYLRYCLKGLSGQEKTGVWTLGSETDFLFYLLDTHNNLNLSFSARPLTGANLSSQIVEIIVNDESLETLGISEMGTYNLTIPNRVISENRLNIRFLLHTAISPNELHINKDERILGLFFNEMSISEVSP